MKAQIPLAILFSALVGCGGSETQTVSAPSNLMSSILTGGVHLTWTDNATNETEFQIERKDPGGQFVKAYSTTFDITQYHDAQVTSGTTYSYRVRAMMGTTASDYSNETTIKVQ